jgi:hypothetical protein
MKKLLLLFPVLFASGVMAQDKLPDLRIQNSGGTVMNIQDVKLLRVEPDGLRVLHAAGTAKVPYELLPEELHVKYGFTAAKAQEHRAVAAAAPAQPATPSPARAPASYAAAASAGRRTSTTTSPSYTSPSVTRRVPTTTAPSCSTGTCGSSRPIYPQSGVTSGLWVPRTSTSSSTTSGTTGYIYSN